MTDNKSPGDRVLDLVVFGPAGLALVAAEEFPRLVDKGRHRLEGQFRTARLVGQAAVQMGRRQLGQLASQHIPKPPSPKPPTPGSGARSSAARGFGTRTSGAETSGAETSGAETSGVGGPGTTATFHDGPDAGSPATAAPETVSGNGALPSLAIPGYDSLSASQVVQRLAGLSHNELIEVREHEQSHRHRRTILNRVEQLLSGVDAE